MPRRSSARHVAYDLRPAKQCERKMLIDSFYAAAECGFAIGDYRYVGMGATKFYDFVLLHKYLGITDMVSVEHDERMIPRAKYNCPYSFIQIVEGAVYEFIERDQFEGNSIYWLDYDVGIGTSVTGDIMSVSAKCREGDFVFVTVAGDPPKFLAKEGGRNRLVELQDRFGDIAGALTLDDVEDQTFPEAVHKIVDAAFRDAYTAKMAGMFQPFFQIEYADGQRMFTYGGLFASEEKCRRFLEVLQGRVPTLTPQPLRRYKIRRLELTEKERRLFDRAVTAATENSVEATRLRELGFDDADFRSYGELLRYYPRYVEALV